MSKRNLPAAVEVRLSGKKKAVFTVILILTPLLFFLTIEIALLVFSYRGNLNLVITKTFGQQRMLALNPTAASRYFANSGMVTPEPQQTPFEITKPANTIRIFCLGESTMQGFPYVFNATAPSFLRDRVQAELPQQHIEVINVGLSAVGSFIVRDFIGDLIPYEPDLFVVYLGHNEFYGIYQEGSAVAIKGDPSLTRLNIWLSRFRTYLLLRDAYVWLTGKSDAAAMAGKGTLMEQSVGRSSISYESPEYHEALATYVENLNAIITVAEEHHVPILFSTVVSNIHDQPPFVSVFAPTTDAAAQRNWKTNVGEGDSAMARGAITDALNDYRNAVSLDSSNAMGRFKYGQALAASGRFDEARTEFTAAKDLDALRFRASEEFNRALTLTCARRNVPVCKIDSAFASASPHGLIGRELILEHLHPNIAGYFLMAKTWARDIRTLGLLGSRLDWTTPPSDSTLMDTSDVSAFDDEVGRLTVSRLTEHWPFQGNATPRAAAPDESISAIALSFLNNKLTWPEARFQVGDLYLQRRQFDLARREFMAVTHFLWFSHAPWIRIADSYFLEHRLADAERFYRQAIAVEDNPDSHMKLGIVDLAQQRPAEGANEVETAFSLAEHQGNPFPPERAAYGRFLLGAAYAQIGRISDARAQLQHALAIQPEFQKARNLLDQLR
ncbi:MAG TPA: tetratricopeptide repeat protein [Bacteroidota bacterium]|nr:tetratricopeptide repeat protein [Bacteroidota bacterium]